MQNKNECKNANSRTKKMWNTHRDLTRIVFIHYQEKSCQMTTLLHFI